MVQRTAIGAVLSICGFNTAAQRNFFMDNEGLDRWTAFSLIDYDDLLRIAKNASLHTATFSIGVLKLKCLAVLKFWIEDKTRMNEPHVTAQFTCATMTIYIKLYSAYVAAKDDNIQFISTALISLKTPGRGFQLRRIQMHSQDSKKVHWFREVPQV